MASGPTWADLMTPGFSTERPSEWKSRMKVIPTHTEPELTFEMSYITQPYENAAEGEVNYSLADFVSVINGAITKLKKESTARVFMVLEPMSLTVSRNGKYSKKQSIGGDEFILSNAYIGKKNNVIYVFKPASVEIFDTMEMHDTTAYEKLLNFRDHIETISGSAWNGIQESIANDLKAKEKEKNAGKAEQYSEWGDW